MNPRIGFIGLGVMGKPMAQRLLESGFPVTVHNRSQGPVAELTASGAASAGSPAETAAATDIVITVLPSGAEVEEVLLGEQGVLTKLRAGATVIDMSTTGPATALEVGAKCAAKEVAFLDAPVSGGERGAISGSLSIMVGGPDAAFERAMPVLATIGASIIRVGEVGAGQLAKAANQILVGTTIAALGEAFTLAERAGVDHRKLREALLGGLASSRVLDQYGQRIIDENFEPGFRARLHLKDLDIAMAAGEQHRLELGITALVRELFRSFVEDGGGELDHSALYTWISRDGAP